MGLLLVLRKKELLHTERRQTHNRNKAEEEDSDMQEQVWLSLLTATLDSGWSLHSVYMSAHSTTHYRSQPKLICTLLITSFDYIHTLAPTSGRVIHVFSSHHLYSAAVNRWFEICTIIYSEMNNYSEAFISAARQGASPLPHPTNTYSIPFTYLSVGIFYTRDRCFCYCEGESLE